MSVAEQIPGYDVPAVEAWIGDGQRVAAYSAPEGMYFIVLAARDAGALPAEEARVSLFTDADESQAKRAEADAREVLRLDGLLRQKAVAEEQYAGHIRHLETLVAERERLVVERDAAVERHTAHIHHLEALVVERDRALSEANAAREEDRAQIAALEKQMISLEVGRTRLESERTRLVAALSAQERVIAYLQSFRGWLGWPWRRFRQWRER